MGQQGDRLLRGLSDSHIKEAHQLIYFRANTNRRVYSLSCFLFNAIITTNGVIEKGRMMTIFSSPEVIAAILGVIGTAFIGGIIYFFKSRKGNRVIIAQTKTTSLIKISERVKQNLKIEYKQVVVDNLILYEFELYNNGDKEINEISLKLNFANINGASFVEVQSADKLNKLEINLPEIHDNGFYEIGLYRPFLNPRKKYKEEVIKFFVFSDGLINFNISGGGEGWYSLLRKTNMIGLINKMIILLSILIIGMISIAVTVPYILLNNITPPSWYKVFVMAFIIYMIFVLFYEAIQKRRLDL